jgi:hypothetical protein
VLEPAWSRVSVPGPGKPTTHLGRLTVGNLERKRSPRGRPRPVRGAAGIGSGSGERPLCPFPPSSLSSLRTTLDFICSKDISNKLLGERELGV